jgi:tryptophanyl-tRNA synthetase
MIHDLRNKKNMESKKETIVSGIQPTGALHIGGYLGAIRNWVELQDEYKGRCYFFTADYHSMNEPATFANYATLRIELAAELLAAGLDPKKMTLFHQKDVPEVTELCWMFDTVVPVSFLERMTQFKDKSGRAQSVNAGLLNYPVLQAADILIYGGDRVPVGEDQIQHVELTRDVARFWNNRFGETFAEPKPLLTKTARVMSLNFPERKMSKSIPGSAIFLADSPDEIRAKVRKAVTATGADEAMPIGVANLFELFAEFGPADEVEKFQKQYKDRSIRYSELKDAVADHIIAYFAPFRARRAELLKHPNEIEKIMKQGAKRARAKAQETMQVVRKKIGF